ncbi:hypothetical protein FIV42_18170 [Persicimonas caeni]|uniref:HEAT repeat domain-containing protein n=1 Tax=Persicimonas caeni TaxID=2292766 RepID=A0A4Y6PW77_PERCE|nr:hypothetical protein [Persicimonas caeni]QDG52592.1 hypothetical protein FIV42_18170 [Persicimonas caeni]QED33814.1 hypothetical protein FRD00_18165 [Persicimonas caeni]
MLVVVLLSVGASSVGVLAGCDRSPEEAPAASAGAGAGVDAEKLVETLEREGVAAEARLEAIHKARDAKVAKAIPALQKLLKSPNPEIVVASAAALNGLDAREATGSVLEAAGRLGRENHYEQLRQLLFIIGDIGGPEARTYLETVADSHDVPPIRHTAGQVLERMN